ncbi:MAG TPA: hypothetical protein VFZ25_06385, partial [Chloroflexota bacterium]|nr:hypothetical protein [Chloroflexota bacterium]
MNRNRFPTWLIPVVAGLVVIAILRAAPAARWLSAPASPQPTLAPTAEGAGGAVSAPAVPSKSAEPTASGSASAAVTAQVATPDTGQTNPIVEPTAAPVRAATATRSANGTTYFVSKLGSNGDGRSWATAWNELDQIKWNTVRPGDTIVLDGGQTDMTYT